MGKTNKKRSEWILKGSTDLFLLYAYTLSNTKK